MSLVQTMILDLCTRAGLDSSLVDVSLVTDANLPSGSPGGYLIERPTTAAAALKEILTAFFIDACESNGYLRFIPRYSQAAVISIPETDLGLESDKAELAEAFGQEQDLPISVTTLYYDATLDYQQGKQLKARNPRLLTVETRNQQILSLPFTLTPDQGRQIAESTLYAAWCNRLAYTLNLWRASYLLLDPADFINFVYQGVTYTARIRTTSLGYNCVVAIEAVSEDARNFVSTAPGGINSGFTSPGLQPTAGTVLFLFDIPLLRDADSNAGGSGFYYALSSASAQWPGGVLYQSSDDASFSQVGTLSTPAQVGSAQTALAAPVSPWAWDTANSVTVAMSVGSLAGDTEANVLDGANAMILGNEILQFVDAVENPDGTFTLSQLLRGRRGTDGACGSHVAGEIAIVPAAGGFARLAEPIGLIGELRYYRGVSIGANLSAVSSEEFTLTGNDLKPYSVVDIGGTLDSSNNWTITWTRRTRFGGSYGTGADALIDGMNGPLNEQTEAYEVDVMSGGTVKRTISTQVATAIYTAAQQTVDFGAVQTTLTVNIYQISATVGRGSQATATLPISGGAPPISVTSGGVYVS